MRAPAQAVLVALAGLGGFATAYLVFSRTAATQPVLVMGAFAALLLGLLIGLVLANAAAAPLRAIGRVARALRDGATDARVQGQDSDDVQALNEALDALTRAKGDAEARLVPLQQEAAKREDDLRRLLGAAQEGLWVYDARAGVAALSPRARQLVGIAESASDVLGAWEAALAPEDRAGLRETLRAAAEGHPTPLELELRAPRGDGSVATLLVRGAARPDGDGSLVAGSIADITQRRRLEGDLAAARAEVAEAHERLAEERARLARALLADPAGPGEATRMFGEWMLLQTAQSPESDPFDPRATAEDATVALAGAARAAGAELILEFDPAVPPRVLGSGARVRRILTLLIEEALLAKGPEVVVSVAHRREELLLWVKDAGPGLPSRVANAPDAPFHDGAETHPNLRLALVHSLARALEGRVGIETARGRGTTVLVTLPAATVPVATTALKPIARARLRGLRALIVDDNASSRRVLSQEAQSWGSIPHAVASADEALAALRADPFDLAIVDQGLPVADGFELARRLRALPHGGLPIVVLTTGDVGLDEVQLETLGIQGAVAKPVRAERLYETLAGVVDHRQFVGERVEVAPARPFAPVVEMPPPPSSIEFRAATPITRPKRAAKKNAKAPVAEPKVVPVPPAERRIAPPEGGAGLPLENRAPPTQRPSLFQQDPNRLRPTPAVPSSTPMQAPPPAAPAGVRGRPLAALDPRILARLRAELGDTLTSDRLAGFIDRSSTHVAEMRGAVATGDAAAFERAARELHRIAVELGVAQLASLSDELATAAHGGRIDAVARRFPELEAAHRTARRAIEVERRRPTL